MNDQKICGIETMATIAVQFELPPYVIHRERKRADGSVRSSFWFQVPKRLRPDGWKALQQLPIDPLKRTGKCDVAELEAVRDDGEALYQKLTIVRDPSAALTGEALALRLAEKTVGTAPWLIAKFKAPADDDTASSKWHSFGPDSVRDYDYAFREIVAWSGSRRPQAHPSLAAMDLPQVLKLLNRFSLKPSKQRKIKVALHALFDVARFEGLHKGANPIQDLPLARMNAREPVEWPTALVEEMCSLAAAKGRASIALFLKIKWWYGWRTRDILRLQEPQHLKDGAFKFRSGKRAKWIGAFVVDEVAAVLDATRPLGTHVGRPIVMNEETGRAYNERVLSRHLRDMLDAIAAGEMVRVWTGDDRRYPELDPWTLTPGLIRHTVMTELEEAGVIDGQSAALVGHSPSSHARMKDTAYRVRNHKLANAAVESLRAHRKRSQ